MKKWLVTILCILPFASLAVWFLAGKSLENTAIISLVLACPLSHIFLMRHDGHGGHRHTKGGERT